MRSILFVLLVIYTAYISAAGVSGGDTVQSPATIKVLSGCPQSGTQGPESGLEAALIGVLAKPAIEAGIQGLSEALLKASGETEKTYSISAVGRTYQYSIEANGARVINRDLGCVIVLASHDWLNDGVPQLDNTEFYLELVVEHAKDGTAFGLSPGFLWYPKRFSSGRDVVEMTVALEFVGNDGQTFGGAMLPFKKRPSEDKFRRNQLGGLVSPWISANAPSSESEALRTLYIDASSRTDDSSKSVTDSLRKQLTRHEPISIRATITETKDVNRFLRTVGTILANNKDAIATASAPFVYESQEAKIQRRTDELTAASTYAIARVQFDEKRAAYEALKQNPDSTSDDKLNAKVAAIDAKYALLKAAVAAGINLPAGDPAETFAP